MNINRKIRFTDVISWALIAYLLTCMPLTEMRVDDFEQPQQPREQQPPVASTVKPEPIDQHLNMGKCFHMPRSKCPPGGGNCTRVGSMSVFCCDLDSAGLKELLPPTISQNTTYLHVLNASIDELDVSNSMFRRLASMAFTDGRIDRITGQFPKYSSIACLNISNNNLTSLNLPLAKDHRPFAHLYNLSILDASANNLTKFPDSLVLSNKKISIDLSDNKYLPCKQFQTAMDTTNSSLVTFLNYNNTYCALDISFNWFKDVMFVKIDHLRVQKEVAASCSKIKPANINCTCVPERLELTNNQITNLVAVDCSQRHLKEMPTELPPNTVKLNVSYNNITSLQAVGDDSSYDHLRQLILDHNDIPHILELEGTKFIDNFMLLSIGHNNMNTIHTYVLSNRFDTTGPVFTIAGNYIHCDCNTEKTLKPWLFENFKNIPDYKSLECENHVAVVDLVESQVCHSPRDWTDYIYYIIGLEVLILVLLVSKVSYDYWVFKTAGYLPWPANKMPRLPCDWLCE